MMADVGESARSQSLLKDRHHRAVLWRYLLLGPRKGNQPLTPVTARRCDGRIALLASAVARAYRRSPPGCSRAKSPQGKIRGIGVLKKDKQQPRRQGHK